MIKFQTQLTNLKNYLLTQGNFKVETIKNDYAPLDELFYEIHFFKKFHPPNFVNTYISKFKTNDDLSNQPFMLNEFIDSTKEKSKLFEQYINYFESSHKYTIQFLNSKTNQLDVIIKHNDTNRKYVLTQSYDIMKQKEPIYHLSREIIFKPINTKCTWKDSKDPVMHIELTMFNRKPTPIDLENMILTELKFDTQTYVTYN